MQLASLKPEFPQVPPEKEEQFWHLVEYFGLMDAFQEAGLNFEPTFAFGLGAPSL